MKTKYIVILFLFFFSDVNADQYDPHLNDLFGQLQNYENQNEVLTLIPNPDNSAPDNSAPDNLAPDNLAPDNLAPEESILRPIARTIRPLFTNISNSIIEENEYNMKREWPLTSNIRCFWCFHTFENIP